MNSDLKQNTSNKIVKTHQGGKTKKNQNKNKNQNKKYNKKHNKKHNKTPKSPKTKRGRPPNRRNRTFQDEPPKMVRTGLKKDACSPYSRGRTVVNKSCFTKGVLFDLKQTYNASHDPTEHIQSNDPREIHETIQKRLPNCKRESCWVQKIARPAVKNKLMSLLFSPPQPKEWKTNPTSWLSNFDILGVLKQYEQNFPSFFFIGPSPIDYNARHTRNRSQCVCNHLCNFSLQQQYDKGIRKIGVIFNLDKHTENGSHWVSLFIDLDEKFIFFFDSSSDPPLKGIRTFMKTVVSQGKTMQPNIQFKKYANRHMEHQLLNNECGMYSLFFIITMLIREKDGKKLTTKDAIRLFLGKRGRISDRDMNELRDDYFLESDDDTEHNTLDTSLPLPTK